MGVLGSLFISICQMFRILSPFPSSDREASLDHWRTQLNQESNRLENGLADENKIEIKYNFTDVIPVFLADATFEGTNSIK